MNIHSVIGQHARRILSAAAALAAIGFAACGGSGGDGRVVVSPQVPPPPPPPPPSACTPEQYADAWASLSCPEGMLCIGDLAGNDVANIAVLAEGNRPDWSPDGSQLVFERPRAGASAAGAVYRINSDGSGETMLAEGREPAWSPDGNKIAFRNSGDIVVMNADGSGAMTLVASSSAQAFTRGVHSPAWSPDGERIAFTTLGDVDNRAPRIFTVKSDGSDAQPLTQPGEIYSIRDPAWSPDGGSIAFIRDTELAVVDAGGGADTRIFGGIPTTPSHWAQTSDWSPDGTVISFSTQSQCKARGIAVIGYQGGSATNLLAGAQQPALSADGTRLAFASAADAFPAITRPASVYDHEAGDSAQIRSRYVVYDDGTFEMQESSLQWGTWSFDGTYVSDGTTFSFAFNNVSSGLGQWRATGTLDGTRLHIEYNNAAHWHDFVDGVYVLSEAQQ